MDLIGKMIAGRYEIIEEVGKGGMAHVYKAHCHFLNRTVAVKVLKEELRDDKEFIQRFNTEAQAAARISNPHVVSVFDVGVENGLYYIVMEYVEGKTLKEYIAEQRVIPWKQAAEFAAQICEGLDAAHKKSVIHRDIKPQNVIMTKGDTLKITDFGIARASTQATTTTANSTIGTVHYLSPEQARGGYTNERTDIYSLGVVLYEMLTGRVPFDDNTAVTIAIKHIQEKPILPRILNSDIPKPMEQIVMKALNKEQSLRYESAAEFLEDLRKVIKNPNVKLYSAEPIGDDDAGHTIKRAPIDRDDLEEYAERTKEKKEESKLRGTDRRRAIREQKKKERRVTIIAIAAAVAVIALLGWVFSAATGGIFEQSEKIIIPDLIDMDYTAAKNKYTAEGLSVILEKRVQSDREKDTIIEQTPAAGESVINRDVIIKVVVSAGTQTKEVGDYTKMDVADAKLKVTSDGFTVNVQEVESSSEKKGTVISQDPAPKSMIPEGTMVTLTVSKGDEDDEDKEDSKNNDSSSSNSSSRNESNNSQDDESDSSSSNNNSTENSDSTAGNTGNSDSSGTASTTGGGTGNSSEGSGGTGSSGNTGGQSGSGETGTATPPPPPVSE